MENPINIAALVPYTVFPAKMGGQKGIALFYLYLKDIAPVTLLCTSDTEAPADFKEIVLPVIGSSTGRYINPALIPKLKKIIKEKGITHLILEHPYYAWLGITLKRITGVKLIVHSHNIESLRFKSTGKWWWKILWQYEKKLHKKADLNFFITEEDRIFAIDHFQLDAQRCVTITYGIERAAAPPAEEKIQARSSLQQRHGIDAYEKILLFNGTLNYLPNLDAVDAILQDINPILLSSGMKYKIIICGKGLPPEYNELKDQLSKNIIYAGFVNDINEYFSGADIFLNPVIEGGGIKTKLVEALGFDVLCITTISGAIGIPENVTGSNMIRIQDNDWNSFANAIINSQPSVIPGVFFTHFYWKNITQKALQAILEIR